MGFEPMSTWITTRGICHYAIATPKYSLIVNWHSRLDSNQHQLVSKTSALLIRYIHVTHPSGAERSNYLS